MAAFWSLRTDGDIYDYISEVLENNYEKLTRNIN